ncbi:MAG: ABC transporter, phosphonate, periplasmic substrate-binding protein [Syntrophorhabdaceae bacterium PtaU1.Bin034]|nr:MAG: ABC transporter, phosphonate, periplasmic substrate-binding protein [Syntrophorhabdaceae bacterium PtaU1.Bin034]
MRGLRLCLLVLVMFSVISSSDLVSAKEVVPVYTPGAGGTLYFQGSALSKVVNKYVPEVQLMVEPTGGTAAIARLIDQKYEKKQPVVATCDSKNNDAAYRGKAPFTKEVKGLRAITFLHGTGLNLVVDAKSPIKSYHDLKGKKVAMGAAGSGTAEIGMTVIAAHGITRDMFKPLWLGYKEVVEGIQDGSIHAGFISGVYPIPAMKELSVRRKIRVIPVESQVLKKLVADNPYFYAENLKAGCYNGVEADTPLLFFGSILVTHAAMDTEVVYKITRAIFEHRDELIEIHPVSKEIDIRTATKTITFPLHPGAEKYFKEVGTPKK